MRRSAFAVLAIAVSATVGAVPVSAQLSDILLGPKTLIDRAIEARSSSDLARDNAIVIDVNKVMADLGTRSVRQSLSDGPCPVARRTEESHRQAR